MASYKDLGNNKYKIYVELGYNDAGKRIRKTKTVTAKSDRALKKAITEFEVESRNTFDSNGIENVLFKDFVMKKWWKLKVSKLKINTRESYKYCLKGGVMDRFGNKKMTKIKTLDLVEYFNEEIENNASRIHQKYSMLKSIFSHAFEWDVIPKNPMERVPRPEQHRVNKVDKEIKSYTSEQLKNMIRELERLTTLKSQLQIKFAALCGLRLTEICSIAVSNIDFEKCTVVIDKKLQWDPEIKSPVLETPKNGRKRTINIPSSMMDDIKTLIKNNRKNRLKLGELWNKNFDENGDEIEFLFVNGDGKLPAPTQPRNVWIHFLKKAKDVPYLNFHGLRHTCASIMVENGIPYHVVKEQLGHSDIQMTLNTYSHAEKQRKSEAIDIFNRFIK